MSTFLNINVGNSVILWNIVMVHNTLVIEIVVTLVMTVA